jgi:hypothetical protein
MWFDFWAIAEAEAVLPGLVLGQYDQICIGCGRAYVVQVDSKMPVPTTCPYCDTENET